MSQYAAIVALVQEKQKPAKILASLEQDYYDLIKKWDGSGDVPYYTFHTYDYDVREAITKRLIGLGYSAVSSQEYVGEDMCPTYSVRFWVRPN